VREDLRRIQGAPWEESGPSVYTEVVDQVGRHGPRSIRKHLLEACQQTNTLGKPGAIPPGVVCLRKLEDEPAVNQFLNDGTAFTMHCAVLDADVRNEFVKVLE
jgi:hypothetical protein